MCASLTLWETFKSHGIGKDTVDIKAQEQGLKIHTRAYINRDRCKILNANSKSEAQCPNLFRTWGATCNKRSSGYWGENRIHLKNT
jgi:hypothetical protein